MESRREILQNTQLAKLANKIDVSKRLPHSQRYSPLSFSHATSPVNRQANHEDMNNFLSQSVANSAMNSMQKLQHNIPINHKAKLAVVHKKSNTLFYEGKVPKIQTMVNVAKNRNFVLYHKRNQNEQMQNDDFKNVMSKYHRQLANKSQIVESFEERQLFSQPDHNEVVEIEKGRDTAILLKPQVIKQKKVIAMNEKKHLKGLKLYKDSIDKRGRQVSKEFRSAMYQSQDNSLGKGSLGSHTARFYDKQQDSIEIPVDNPAQFMNGGKKISIESRESSLNRVLASGDHTESKHFESQAHSTVKTLVTQKGIQKGYQDIYDSLNGKDTIDQGDFISCLTGAITYFNQKRMNTSIDKGKGLRQANEQIMNENKQLRQQSTRASQYQSQMNSVLIQKDQMIEDQEQIIYQMRQQMEDMQVSLKESEIRLAHTTELFTREKIEKESTAIAFKRIINKMTNDPNEQRKKQIRTQSTTAMSPGRCSDIMEGNYEEFSYYGKAQRLEDQLNDRELELSKLKNQIARGVMNSTESIEARSIASAYDEVEETYNFNPYHMEEQESPSYSDSSLRNLYAQPYPTPFSETQLNENQTNCENNSLLYQHLKHKQNKLLYFQSGSTRADTLQNNSGFRKQEEYKPKMMFVSPSREESNRCVPESLIKKQTNEQRYW